MPAVCVGGIVNTPDLFDLGSVTSRLKSEFGSERLPLKEQMVRLI
jgi:hypothetical protein